MRQRYVAVGNSWVPIEDAPESVEPSVYVRGDLPDYVSPVTGKVVSGRRQRREDLKRHGCIELGPNDFKPRKD